MLLAQLGIIPARVVSPDIDETPLRDEQPRPYAQRMAFAKAAAVPSEGALVLAGDTALEWVVGKLADLTVARWNGCRKASSPSTA